MKFFYKIYLLFSVLYFFVSSFNYCFSQQLHFERFTTANGLSENYVYKIMQDSKGYLWIGTHDGLNRYDGYEFKKFRHNAADSNSLPDNTVVDICEDGTGCLWLTTNSCLCKFDVEKNKFTVVDVYKSYATLNQVLLLSENEIMLKHGDEIFLLNTNTFKKTEINCSDSTSVFNNNYPKSVLVKNSEGIICVGKNVNGIVYLFKYNNSEKVFFYFTRFAVNGVFKQWSLNSILLTSENYCWLSFYGVGTTMINLKKGIEEIQFKDGNKTFGLAREIIEDDLGNIWFANADGLLRHNLKTGTTSLYSNDNNENSLSANQVLAVFQDKQSVLWVGTSNGLNKLNLRQEIFKHLTVDASANNSLQSNFILGIRRLQNDVVRIKYNADYRKFSDWNITDNSIHGRSISDYNDTTWFKNEMLINPERLTPKLTDSIIYYLRKSFKGDYHSSVCIIDKNEQVWVVGYIGLWHLDKNFEMYAKNFLVTSVQLYNNEIWIATDGDGLMCFDTDLKKLTKFKTIQQDKNAINSNEIEGFIFDANGNIWIATKGGGLNYFNRNTKKFTHYTEQDGLCNNSIYCITDDDNNCLWLGTSNGLSCFDARTKTFKNYFHADGLINSEFNRNSACKLDDGTIIMGGMNGIDYFNPAEIIKNKTTPQIQITGFELFNQSIDNVQNKEFKPGENYITIKFATMDFIDPAGNKFKCKLDGIDKNWIDLQQRNFITYSLLPHGHYHFSVMGANSNGEWSEHPASIDFTILPPWYNTLWFYTVILVILIFSTWLIVRIYVKQKLNKQRILLEKQRAIELERIRISTELHDDIGGELSAIRLLSGMSISQIDPGLQLTKISASSAELVQKMNEIVWALNINNDSLQSLITYIRRYAIKYFDELNIDCNFKQPDTIPSFQLDGIARRNIFLLVKEVLNNIAKHAAATSVSISIEILNNNLAIQIHDNGKGISDEALQSINGNGLRNMQQRVKNLGGTMQITNNAGTLVQFNLPL